MQALFLSLAALACPIGMGAMMWMMMRGKNNGANGAVSSDHQQVADLRAEIDKLKADRAAQRTPGEH